MRYTKALSSNTTFIAMHLPIPVALIIQKIISQTLPLDPDTQRALETIDSKVIAIKVQQPPIEFALSIVDRDIQLLRVFDAEADTTLKASLSDFIAMQSSDTVIKSGRITISGDQQLANDFALIVYRSEVDWQDALAPFLGETLVHKLGEVAKRFGLWAGETKTQLREDTSDYLQEEADLLVSPNQASSFSNKLDKAAQTVESLEQRIAALEQSGRGS